jgi:hypothetical protein
MDETVSPTHGAELGDCFAQSFVEDGLAELLGVPAERLGRPAPATLVDRAALDGFRGGRGKGQHGQAGTTALAPMRPSLRQGAGLAGGASRAPGHCRACIGEPWVARAGRISRPVVAE